MPGYVAYVVSISAMLLAALSGLTLITCARHLDPLDMAPPTRTPVPDQDQDQEKIAV
jgi:hypothetical protein